MENRRNDDVRPANRTVRLRIAVLAAAILAAGLPGACGAPSSAGGDAKTPAASPSASSPSVAEDLTFSGALAGRMTSGSAGDTYVCASTGGNFVAGPILGTVAGQQVELNITKLSFTGPGTYTPGGVSFDVATSHYYPATGAPGSFVVASDLQSGTIDINLAVNTDPNTVVARVTGTWRCPPGGS